MTQTQKISIAISFAIIGIAAALMYITSQRALGSAPSGLYASVATTSSLQVGPNYVQVLLAPRENCAARVISTGATPIRLAFGGLSATSTATSTSYIGPNVGLWLAASTTVVYDGGVYGCGFIGTVGGDITTSTVSTQTFN